MNPRNLFVVGVRLFGVWELLRCIDYVVECFDLKADYYRTNLYTVGAAYTHILTYLVVGLFLLGKAPRVAGIFYPPEPDPPVSGPLPRPPEV